MAYVSSGLRDAFEGQGQSAFMVFTYTSRDPIEQVLAPGYFQGCSRLQVGDLIYLGIRAQALCNEWGLQKRTGELRRALLMVAGTDGEGRQRVRLVQDFGRPDDPDAPIMQPKRPRGRPAKVPVAAGQ